MFWAQDSGHLWILHSFQPQQSFEIQTAWLFTSTSPLTFMAYRLGISLLLMASGPVTNLEVVWKMKVAVLWDELPVKAIAERSREKFCIWPWWSHVADGCDWMRGGSSSTTQTLPQAEIHYLTSSFPSFLSWCLFTAV